VSPRERGKRKGEKGKKKNKISLFSRKNDSNTPQRGRPGREEKRKEGGKVRRSLSRPVVQGKEKCDTSSFRRPKAKRSREKKKRGREGQWPLFNGTGERKKGGTTYQ